MRSENYYEENGELKKRIIDIELPTDLQTTDNIRTLPEIKARMESLSQDFVQVQLGAKIEDIEERKKEFISLQNELRSRMGKPPRIYQ